MVHVRFRENPAKRQKSVGLPVMSDRVAEIRKAQIRCVPIDQIQISDVEIRKHSEEHVSQVAAMIKQNRYFNPIPLNKGKIVTGVARYRAALKLEMPLVPVIDLDHLSEAGRRTLAISDNKTVENGKWNYPMLAVELKSLTSDPDFNSDLTGFRSHEIDNIIIMHEPLRLASEAEPVPEPEEGPPVSRLGDGYALGPSKLYCADAEQPESYRVLMGEERARMVFSDPPSNKRIAGNVSGRGRKKHDDFVMASGEMSKDRFTNHLANTFKGCADVSTDGSIHFHCMDHAHIREMLDAGEAAYSEMKNLVIWDKGAGLGSFYRNSHELIFVWKVGKAKHINNFGLGEKGRFRTNLWKYPGAAVGRKGRLQDLAMHPTVKPVTMVMDAIRDVSNRGDIVLDPYCGSGTTIIAAGRTGRRARCLELDPKYVDVAIRRWERETGKNAVHIETGLTFKELAETRGFAADEDPLDGEGEE